MLVEVFNFREAATLFVVYLTDVETGNRPDWTSQLSSRSPYLLHLAASAAVALGVWSWKLKRVCINAFVCRQGNDHCLWIANYRIPQIGRAHV